MKKLIAFLFSWLKQKIIVGPNKELQMFVIENTWLPRGDLFSHGWGNGYVALPRSHPCYGISCEDIDVDVHGGLTLGCYTSDFHKESLPKDINKDAYIVGFDTVHYQDTIEKWPKTRVLLHTKKLKEQLESYKPK